MLPLQSNSFTVPKNKTIHFKKIHKHYGPETFSAKIERNELLPATCKLLQEQAASGCLPIPHSPNKQVFIVVMIPKDGVSLFRWNINGTLSKIDEPYWNVLFLIRSTCAYPNFFNHDIYFAYRMCKFQKRLQHLHK